MGQIAATRNLVATKVVRLAGQWFIDVRSLSGIYMWVATLTKIVDFESKLRVSSEIVYFVDINPRDVNKGWSVYIMRRQSRLI